MGINDVGWQRGLKKRTKEEKSVLGHRREMNAFRTNKAYAKKMYRNVSVVDLKLLFVSSSMPLRSAMDPVLSYPGVLLTQFLVSKQGDIL